MKKLLIILSVAFVCFSFGTEYCDGWADGYSAGYCYNSGYACIPRIAPLCPLPKLGKDSYQDGYNRGFLRGMADAR